MSQNMVVAFDDKSVNNNLGIEMQTCFFSATLPIATCIDHRIIRMETVLQAINSFLNKYLLKLLIVNLLLNKLA